MNFARKHVAIAAGAAIVVLLLVGAALRSAMAPKAAPTTGRPVLTVSLVKPQKMTLPLTISANGNVAAWQEAVIGTETNGLRLSDVLVNVGDAVQRGQILATFDAGTVQADLNQSRAALAEARAALSEAAANAQRARKLAKTGALSQSQISQYLTAERTARARVDAQTAAQKSRQLHLVQTTVLAPDTGIISARNATVGAVLPAGTEMFRLIRQGRLEWRAEVSATDIGRITPGAPADVVTPGGGHVQGRVRVVSPTIDEKTRNGIVYVDLVERGDAKAGMFASGTFDVGSGAAMTLPQSAVLMRDGFSYVMRVGPDSRVSEVKVGVGQRAGERIAVTSGLDAAARVVASGSAFLVDGDVVRVVDAPLAASSAAAQ